MSVMKFKIEQIIKKVLNPDTNQSSDLTIYPKTAIQAVLDVCTGEKLDEILLKGNHIFVPYKRTEEKTYLSINHKYRRKGLVVTYIDSSGSVVTKQYVGLGISDDMWSTSANWKTLESNPDTTASGPDHSTDISRIQELIKTIQSELTRITDVISTSGDIDLSPVEEKIATLVTRVLDLERKLLALTQSVDSLPEPLTEEEIKEIVRQLIPPASQPVDLAPIQSEIAQLKEQLARETRTREELAGKITSLQAKEEEQDRKIAELARHVGAFVDTNKYVVRGKLFTDENKLRLFYNDDTHFDIPLEDEQPVVVPSALVKGGYKVTDDLGNYATMTDLVHEIGETLEFTIPSSGYPQGEYGYWGAAIPKSLASSINKIEIFQAGSWYEMVSGYTILDEGEYLIIQDNDYEEIADITLRINHA